MTPFTRFLPLWFLCMCASIDSSSFSLDRLFIHLLISFRPPLLILTLKQPHGNDDKTKQRKVGSGLLEEEESTRHVLYFLF